MLDPSQRFRIVSAMTEYDRKQSTKKGCNYYALALYLEAFDRAQERIAAGASVRAALVENFNDRLLDVCLKAIGEPRATIEEHRSR